MAHPTHTPHPPTRKAPPKVATKLYMVVLHRCIVLYISRTRHTAHSTPLAHGTPLTAHPAALNAARLKVAATKLNMVVLHRYIVLYCISVLYCVGSHDTQHTQHHTS